MKTAQTKDRLVAFYQITFYFIKANTVSQYTTKVILIAGVGGSNNRSSSLGRNTSLFNHITNQDKTSSDKFRQVTRPSVLSPQQNMDSASDDRESCV